MAESDAFAFETIRASRRTFSRRRGFCGSYAKAFLAACRASAWRPVRESAMARRSCGRLPQALASQIYVCGRCVMRSARPVK